jgi:hypothetical protein
VTTFRRDIGVELLSILAAIVAANVVHDVLRRAIVDDVRGASVALLTAALLAGTGAAFSARLRGVRVGRAAGIALVSSATVVLLLVRMPSPWIDLGPFGAGPLTRISLIVLPVAQIAAVLALRRWGER